MAVTPTTQTSNGRGCGTRDAGDLYICSGQSPLGRPIEDFIIDPVIPYTEKWQRGHTLVMDEEGVNHVVIFVGKEYYPSPWDFIEEVKRFGASRKLAPTFPFEELTVGRSTMFFCHARATPTFEYVEEVAAYDTCRYAPDMEGRTFHPEEAVEDNKHCIYKLRGIAPFCYRNREGAEPIEESIVSTDENPHFISSVNLPSFNYTVTVPMSINGQEALLGMPPSEYTLPKNGWEKGLFLQLMITHFESKEFVNPETEGRANESGYEHLILDY